MSKIVEILRMGEELGFSQRKISEALGISRKTVSDYLYKLTSLKLSYSEIKKMSYEELQLILEDNKESVNLRYAALSSKFDYMLQELKKTGVTLHLLWEEYLQSNPSGYKYSQFCHHFQNWLKPQKATMHIEHKAGEKMFVDFAGKKLRVINRETGEERKVEVFVAVLGASQLTYVEALYDQGKSEWLKANVNALEYFGGVPQAIVPDNLKSGVIKSNKYEPEINPDYLDFAQHYGTVILPARPYKPRDKSLVEGAVNIVYKWIYSVLRNREFFSITDLNKAIREELEKYNNRPKQKEKVSRRELFTRIEKDSLQPLPKNKYRFKEFLKLKVQFNYHIYLSKDKHYYSVPYQYVDKKVEVITYDSGVEIYYQNKRIAYHKRVYGKNKYSTLSEHMPQNHKMLKSWTPEKILSHAERKGKAVKDVVEAILGRRAYPEQSFKSCLGIINLTKYYDIERLNAACKRALHFGQLSYSSIQSILQKGLDKMPVNEDFDKKSQLPVHENIRGKDYYKYYEEKEI